MYLCLFQNNLTSIFPKKNSTTKRNKRDSMIKIPLTSSTAAPPPCRIYADNAATTVIRKSALDKYISACMTAFGNPSSQHSEGKRAHELLDWSRAIHARFMGVPPDCVFFTSSGTESNNIIIRGILAKMRRTNGRSIIITSAVEHSSIRKTAELAAGAGNHIMAPVTSKGYIDEVKFREILQSNARNIALVSIILAQNEVGTLQRIPALVQIVRETVGPEVPFHTDATQAFGKYFVNPEALGVDLMTASAHKYHGPRGVGILYAKTGLLDPSTLPITGGGQEHGCRSGTENVPAIAAAATALYHMLGKPEVWMERKARVRAMRDIIISGILRNIPGSSVNGDPPRGLYNLASFVLPGVSGVDISKRLDEEGIAIGSGSACNKGRPSEGMLAMGKTPDEIRGVIRISLSESNTPQDCEDIISAVVRAWRRARSV